MVRHGLHDMSSWCMQELFCATTSSTSTTILHIAGPREDDRFGWSFQIGRLQLRNFDSAQGRSRESTNLVRGRIQVWEICLTHTNNNNIILLLSNYLWQIRDCKVMLTMSHKFFFKNVFTVHWSSATWPSTYAFTLHDFCCQNDQVW